MTDVVEENGDEMYEESAGEFEDDEFIQNPLKRAWMVLFSPTRVFESVAAKSTRMDWLVPIMFSILFTLIFINAGFDFLMNDQRITAIEKIENNSKFTEEQKADQIEKIGATMEKMKVFSRVISNVFAAIGAFASIAVIALVMLAVTNLMLKANLTFGDAYKIGALGSMTSLVGTIIQLPLVFYFESVNQSKLSLASFLPEGMSEAFFVQLLDFNIFTLWYAIVLGIGMAVFAKTTFAKTFVPLCAMWLIYRVAAIMISGAF